jgi:hypothetical protein
VQNVGGIWNVFPPENTDDGVQFWGAIAQFSDELLAVAFTVSRAA